MLRIFCDICGVELDMKGAYGRSTFEHGRLTVSIMIAIDNTWNAGHACPACIEKAIVLGKLKEGATPKEEE